MLGSFVILTEASGSGKTAIAEMVKAIRPEITVFRFDTIGIPSVEVMGTFGTGHQPGGAWQRAMTLESIERIAPILLSGDPVLFEGQMRVAFKQEAPAMGQIIRPPEACAAGTSSLPLHPPCLRNDL